MFNLSILTSDVYNLVVGVYIFGLELTWLYGVAFIVIMVGLAIFHSNDKKDSEVNIV
jgi:solute carrier family 35, member F1/2